MADVKKLEGDAMSFAQKATSFDQQGLFDMAITFYCEAAQALRSAQQAGSNWPNMLEKANEYSERAEALKQLGNVTQSVVSPDIKSSQQLGLDRAKFLIEQAFEEDFQGNCDEAFKMYTEAAELCLKLRGETKDDLQSNIIKLAEQALERAETLKPLVSKTGAVNPSGSQLSQLGNSRLQQPSVSTPVMTTNTSVPAKKTLGPLGLSLRDDDSTVSTVNTVTRRTSGYTAEELQVLRTTSTINGLSYVPFFETDAREKFAFPVPFTDKSGMLALSPKQRKEFGKWLRPESLCDNPQMICVVSSFSIKQTIVSDCSFVASLAIAAQYERRFNKKLITSIIYPLNRSGDPEYNPCGKYMVKLHINGVLRKVIIDDYLPVSRDGRLLCSYSNNRNELWVSMLEKAYMKVMGGYDFPGSNSNIDLHALTGWIPERVSMKSSKSSSEEFNAEREFQRIRERFHKGHCLVTIATGEMSDGEADRAGLVPTHAYAMLDIQVVEGYRLFQLKNPWSHMRWKGNFSEKDSVHWTESMKKALSYDPHMASVVDNGVFWIDYDSLQRFFDVIYINWNPDLFPFTTCYHQTWAEGPKKDSYSIGQNPQYKLEVSSQNPSAVWILLTRHITDKDDFAENKEFITVLVYKTDGRRVYYPYDPAPYIDGIRINSPHYLCKMVLQPGTNLFTLVVSQYERNNTIHYTLRVYSSTDFKLTRVISPYNPKYDKQVTGEWKGRSAGGCGNYPETAVLNPTYQLKVDSKTTDNHILVELRGPKTFSVGFDIFTVSENIPNGPGSFTKKSSGDFRRGYVYLELSNLSGGIYNIRPCTFYPKQEAPFFLNISSTSPITLQQIS